MIVVLLFLVFRIIRTGYVSKVAGSSTWLFYPHFEIGDFDVFDKFFSILIIVLCNTEIAPCLTRVQCQQYLVYMYIYIFLSLASLYLVNLLPQPVLWETRLAFFANRTWPYPHEGWSLIWIESWCFPKQDQSSGFCR